MALAMTKGLCIAILNTSNGNKLCPANPPVLSQNNTILSLVSDPSAKPSKVYIRAYKASSSCGMHPSKERTGDALLLYEDCQLKQPTYGMPVEGRKRW